MKIIPFIDLSENFKEILPSPYHDKGGCYRLFWSPNGKTKSIPRMITPDISGTLYIGQSDNLLKRMNSLEDTIYCNLNNEQESYEEKGHKALSKKNFRIRKHFNSFDDFKVAVIALDKKDPKKLESYLLEMYANRFGELPPLNGQYGKYSFDEFKSILSESELSMFYSAKA